MAFCFCIYCPYFLVRLERVGLEHTSHNVSSILGVRMQITAPVWLRARTEAPF